ncbi:adenosine deaminase [Chlamydia crocodili]|uniref:Adenosine deaminase n=1 Tax=Chlamydia crocodili TaxID=2766982 RepID=A0ABX8CDV6_9CHLA|nr:adenosine deaminase [Chlamydia crocodili]QVE49102.1 adenosine deaminase [Chlamydia crocodili]
MIDKRLFFITQQLSQLASELYDNIPCTSQFIKNLPKADIHVHLPGTISPETAWELGVRNGLIKWENNRWISPYLSNGNPHKNYSEIFRNFENICYERDPNVSLLKYAVISRDFSSFDRIMATVQGHRYPPGGIQNENDLWLVLQNYLKQCLQDNIIYTEVQQNIRIAYVIYPSLEPQEARLRLYGLFSRASQFFQSQGIILRFINCFNKTGSSNLRQSTQQRSEEAASWLDEVETFFPNLFVGLQSAGAEICPEAAPIKLTSGYRHAYEKGFGCEAHAGEGTGFLYLSQTLQALPIQRIAHGFQAIEHLPTIHEIQEKNITLVMAPVINLILGASLHQYSGLKKTDKIIINNLDEHPFFALLRDHKLSITLSSDNPQMGGTSLQNTLLLLSGFPAFEDSQLTHVKYSPLTLKEIIQLNTKAIVSSFVDTDTKITLLNKILGYLSEEQTRLLSTCG